MVLIKILEAEDVLNEYGEMPALRFAAKLNCLGEYRTAIKKAASAEKHPEYYREMGLDPEELVVVGIQSLRQLIAKQHGQP